MSTVDQVISQSNALLALSLPEAVDTLLQPYLQQGSAPIPFWKLKVIAARRQNHLAEALQIQRMIVDNLPGDLPARYDLSELLLASGDFENGWREYRYRYDLPHTKVLTRHVQKPRWQGQPLHGKTLYIHDEQGFGDTFQFLRLVRPAVELCGGQVLLEVNTEAYPFACRAFRGMPVTITQRGQIPLPFDVHVELMSLPHALNLRVEDLPVSMPYLSADVEKADVWKRRLDDLMGVDTPRVALVWAGRPTHPNDGNRSMQLKDFDPLAELGIPLIGIQKGPAAQQDAPDGMVLHRMDDSLHSFEDTAALLQHVDLLISVDSSPVHLAGALGKPAWVLLPFEAEWRWMTERLDTPWYPQHRLYRQSRRGDWTGPLQQMVRDFQTTCFVRKNSIKNH